MIIWLASWPRSGNTLLRLIIEQCFGLKTYTKYANEKTESLSPDEITDDFEKLRNSEEIFCIKTHELPEDDSRVLYVIRDGRDAFVSLSYYYGGMPLDHIINAGFISMYENEYIEEITDESGKITKHPDRVITNWSDHVTGWYSNIVKNGFIIRYEDMVQRPDIVLSILESCLRRERKCNYSNNFNDLHLRQPRMFREGRIGSWKKEFTSQQEELFWDKHGKVMTMMNYTRERLN